MRSLSFGISNLSPGKSLKVDSWSGEETIVQRKARKTFKCFSLLGRFLLRFSVSRKRDTLAKMDSVTIKMIPITRWTFLQKCEQQPAVPLRIFEFSNDGGKTWQRGARSKAFWRKNEPELPPANLVDVEWLERKLKVMIKRRSEIFLFPSKSVISGQT